MENFEYKTLLFRLESKSHDNHLNNLTYEGWELFKVEKVIWWLLWPRIYYLLRRPRANKIS